MGTITIKKYSFIPPKSISEMDYNSYKQMIIVDYHADICPKEATEDRGVSVKKVARWSLTAVAAILAPAAAISRIESDISRSKANKEMDQFYNGYLKRLMIKSVDYKNFIKEYNR